MKVSEFRKLIREEVRKVLVYESKMLKNVKAFTQVKINGRNSLSTAKVQKLFGSFLSIKRGPTRNGYVNNYVVDLNVDALVSLLKSNKDYKTIDVDYAVEIIFKDNDSVFLKGLPKDVFNNIAKAGKTDTNTSAKATANSSDLKKIEGFILSHPAFESTSPSRLKSITKEIFEEWKAVAENYNDLQAYLDEMDEHGGLEAFM
jgi:hypothetical protein